MPYESIINLTNIKYFNRKSISYSKNIMLLTIITLKDHMLKDTSSIYDKASRTTSTTEVFSSQKTSTIYPNRVICLP